MDTFDQSITRRHTGSLKWDRRPDLIPLWVADMDFPSPPEVIEALQARVNHGVYGYALPHPSLIEALLTYLKNRLNFVTSEESLIHLGGLVPALSLAARAFGQPGDDLLTCTPVYPPFLSIHKDAQMNLIAIDHVQHHGHWTFDWEKLEAQVTPKTRLFLLSNPQNPLGRVFTESEITQLAQFCQKHQLVLVSDEIHCDLIYDESRTPHFSALNLPEDLRNLTITLLAPSKTYNIAGLGYAFAVIPNEKLRRQFNAARGHTLAEINALAYHAAEAAYRYGEPWRQNLLAYLQTNRDLLTSSFQKNLPQAKIPEIQATYLAWVDCRELPHENPATVLENAGYFVSDGTFFGHPKCLRINFGTQTSALESALEPIIAALAP